MKNIAIFVSGSGTNCENIINYFNGSKDVNIAVVISNKADAYALVRAANHGIPTEMVSKAELNDENFLMPLLQKYSIDFVVLAGFLLMAPSFLIDAYEKKIINLHPALLPKFGGKGMYGHHVHEAIKAAGETETGMTVHYVSRECDGGEIIAQFRMPITAEDTPDDIAEKEHILEMKYFPSVIENVVKGLNKYVYKKVCNKYIISIFNHQEISNALVQFCEEMNIHSGEVSGLGAVNEAVLRCYDPVSKHYVDKTFDQQMEIANLTGNISSKDGKVYPHIHITLGREDYSAVAGHLLSATINGACELFVEDYGVNVNRRLDEETGLNLYKF